jgi:endothelin-converting enzyme/putative endopeptidase
MLPVNNKLAAWPLAAALTLTAAPGSPAEPASTPPVAAATFDLTALDRSVDACTDFYQFACGGWLARNPIPADQSRWGRFNELEERNRATLRGILEKASADAPGRDPLDQKIGDYYASCMDEGGIEAKGIRPLRPEQDLIAAVTTKPALAGVVAHLHLQGVNVLFSFASTQDFKDATAVIAEADQGGLGLPDRDYYFREDAKSVEIRTQYLTHVKKMLGLLGDKPEAAERGARAVMDIETALARASLDVVSRRDPAKIYHKMGRGELAALSPAFDWSRYLQGVNAPAVQSLNVAVPDFFKGMEGLLPKVPLEDLKTYLRWQLVHASAPLLPAAFVSENFSFFGKILTGATELRPRWKRCTDFTDSDLGEALGRRYVEQTFGPKGKERTIAMVAALEKALARDIQELTWMTEPTKKEALKKLGAIANKIGYPDRWRDYRSLEIVRGDALGNSLRSNAFELQRRMAKIGRPVDRDEWLMTPPTVNAYYNPLMNDINFPAGILQPPFFDNAIDDAVNFGAIGAVIGHELTHGFDDQGRQFGPTGNLQDWWKEEDAREFEKRSGCVADQYSGYTAVADVKVNGRLTLGENVADNGGVRIAYRALRDVLAGQEPAAKDGFTADQRLFLGWGQIWCANQRDEIARLLAQTDPHSPPADRVNGVVSNVHEFANAFGCKAGASMVRERACRVW